MSEIRGLSDLIKNSNKPADQNRRKALSVMGTFSAGLMVPGKVLSPTSEKEVNIKESPEMLIDQAGWALRNYHKLTEASLAQDQLLEHKAQELVGHLDGVSQYYVPWEVYKPDFEQLDVLHKAGRKREMTDLWEEIRKKDPYRQDAIFNPQDLALIGWSVGEIQKGELKVDMVGGLARREIRSTYFTRAQTIIEAVSKRDGIILPEDITVTLGSTDGTMIGGWYSDKGLGRDEIVGKIVHNDRYIADKWVEQFTLHELGHYGDIEVNPDLIRFLTPEEVYSTLANRVMSMTASEFPRDLGKLLNRREWDVIDNYPNIIWLTLGAYPYQEGRNFLWGTDDPHLIDPGLSKNWANTKEFITDPELVEWRATLTGDSVWRMTLDQMLQEDTLPSLENLDLVGALGLNKDIPASGLNFDFHKKVLIALRDLVVIKALVEGTDKVEGWFTVEDRINISRHVFSVMRAAFGEKLAEVNAHTENSITAPLIHSHYYKPLFDAIHRAPLGQ